MNSRGHAFEKQVEIYLGCAAGLAASIAPYGIRYRLLTNDPDTVAEVCRRLGVSAVVQVEKVECQTSLPSGTPFFSAHFKWDAYAHLAAVKDASYVILADLDIVAINPPPQAFVDAVESGIPLCYDVSGQIITAYGSDVVLRDLKKLDPSIRAPAWFGGEWLGGPPSFFAEVYAQVQPLVPEYVRHIPTLHHVSDESVTSAVLARMRQDGACVSDAGATKLVARFWSIPTLHRQPPLRAFSDVFLLHLPADKSFLAMRASEGSSGRAFYDAFARHYRARHVRRLRKRLTSLSNRVRGAAARAVRGGHKESGPAQR